jgi:hypothetical protein
MDELQVAHGRAAATPTESRREQELRREAEERQTAWAFVWILFAFKIATLVATFWAAAGSMDAALILMVTNWFWIALPMFAIWGPVIFHLRKRRARWRRGELMRAEWMVE